MLRDAALFVRGRANVGVLDMIVDLFRPRQPSPDPCLASAQAGKELDKDGFHGELFFYLATPKQEHFVMHSLTLRSPGFNDYVDIYAMAVDDDGEPLKNISLLIHDNRSERFQMCESNQPVFAMKAGSTRQVKFRIETPSKCNMVRTSP